MDKGREIESKTKHKQIGKAPDGLGTCIKRPQKERAGRVQGKPNAQRQLSFPTSNRGRTNFRESSYSVCTYTYTVSYNVVRVLLYSIDIPHIPLLTLT